MDDLNRCRAAADGSFFQHAGAYKTVQLLIVDDFLTTPISTRNAVDLLEIMEAREGRAATLIASQLEPNEWYLIIEGELMADSTLNRIATGRATSTSMGRTYESASQSTGCRSGTVRVYQRYRRLPTGGTIRADSHYQIGLLLIRAATSGCRNCHWVSDIP